MAYEPTYRDIEIFKRVDKNKLFESLSDLLDKLPLERI